MDFTRIHIVSGRADIVAKASASASVSSNAAGVVIRVTVVEQVFDFLRLCLEMSHAEAKTLACELLLADAKAPSKDHEKELDRFRSLVAFGLDTLDDEQQLRTLDKAIEWKRHALALEARKLRVVELMRVGVAAQQRSAAEKRDAA